MGVCTTSFLSLAPLAASFALVRAFGFGGAAFGSSSTGSGSSHDFFNVFFATTTHHHHTTRRPPYHHKQPNPFPEHRPPTGKKTDRGQGGGKEREKGGKGGGERHIDIPSFSRNGAESSSAYRKSFTGANTFFAAAPASAPLVFFSAFFAVTRPPTTIKYSDDMSMRERKRSKKGCGPTCRGRCFSGCINLFIIPSFFHGFLCG